MGALEYRKMCNAGTSQVDLRKQYTDACNAYRDALNKMWDTNGYWIDDDCWWFDVADCVIGIAEVRELVDRAVDFDTFLAWYDYDMQIHYGQEHGYKEAIRINLHTWLNGFPEDKKVPMEMREAWEKEYWENL